MDNNNMNQDQQNTQYQQNAYQQNGYAQNTYQQNAYQQPGQYQNYQQPQYQNYQTNYETPVTVGDWMLSMLLLCIPLVNIIMMFVWAFGGSAQKSKANFFKAYLIWFAIGLGLALILYIILFAIVGVTMAELM